MSTPLVTIVILNYKRLAALEKTIQSVVAQRYPRKEIIVVDNHSEEDVAAVVRKYGADIRLIELEANVGACGGRNAGIQSARGNILITLDNDVSFLTENAIDAVARVFDDEPEYHVLAFKLCDPDTGALRLREWCHPKDWRHYADKRFSTHFFVEGAAAFRREVFERAGMYFEPLFVYNEGWDFGLRILDKGYRILYTPEIRAGHLMSPEGRGSSRPYFLFPRNYIWIAYRDYPLWPGLRFLFFRLAMLAAFALCTRHFGTYLRGIWAGIRGCRSIGRAPVSRQTIAYVDALDAERPSIFVRWARHRAAPQL